MKKNSYIRICAMSIVIAVLSVACDDNDDPVNNLPGDGENRIEVADGFYITAEGVAPTSAGQLSPEQVEDADFAAQERPGFLANYVYLTAGAHQIVQIFNQEIDQTIGGTAAVADNASTECPDATGEYQVVTAEIDGAAFDVASEGLYKVVYDNLSKEILTYKINQVGIIGSATPSGWGGSTNLDGAVSADGGQWTATNITLTEGEWKIRFNCNWSIDRRIDPDAGFAAENGYMLFTNFSGIEGDPSNLSVGNVGSNLVVNAAGDGGTEEAVFTLDIIWSPEDGFSVTLTKTGDFTPPTWSPDDFNWGIIGDATNSADEDADGTPDGWQTDTDMILDAVLPDHTWTLLDSNSNTGDGTIQLEGGLAFKFRANDAWDVNFGWGQVTLAGDTDNFTEGDGGNIAVTSTATYKISLFTGDEGETYTATFEEQ